MHDDHSRAADVRNALKALNAAVEAAKVAGLEVQLVWHAGWGRVDSVTIRRNL